jgi:tetratricopeptide (TPR) repeat protein
MRLLTLALLFVAIPSAALGRAPAARAGGDAATVGQVERLLRTGRYEQARKAADGVRRRGRSVRLAILAARAERALGELRDARARLEEASITAPDDLPLRAELIKVLEALGDRGALKDLTNRTYEDWSRGRVDRKNAAQLTAVAIAVRQDGNWEDANATFRDAVKADPRAVEAHLEWGATFLEKHAADNAALSFKDALKTDPENPDAHAGLARALLDASYDEAAAERELAAALAVNPRHAQALALRGEIALDAEEFATVTEVVAALRRTNPRDPDAAWLAASRALLLEDRPGFEAERDRRLEARPGDGEFFWRTAEALVRHRRYEDAREVAEAGVAVAPGHARLLASVGTTRLRLGDEAAGLEALKRAWDRDPYNVRTFNQLELFEKIIPSRYVTVATAHLRFRVEPAARAAIEKVVAPFLEATYASYVARYGVEPKGPIVFELYGRPEHFAVRTVGLPRLGVAGVCFGRVITSLSPTNGDLNWGMVLAHELAHTFALELSRARVPRWFTEGLAELEASRLRPEWRRTEDLELAAAYKADALAPLASLSQSFVRARSPEAASLAYMQSAVALEWLEARFGFEKIREALVAFGRGARGPAVLAAATGLPPESLERAFREELDRRAKPYAGQFLPETTARVGGFGRAAESAGARDAAPAIAGVARLARDDVEGAQRALGPARARPGAARDPLVRYLEAGVALHTDRAGEAAALLDGLIAGGVDGYDVQLRRALAALRGGDRQGLERHLLRASALAPGRVEPRALLAEHFRAAGRADARAGVILELARLDPQSGRVAKEALADSARAGRPGAVVDLAPMALFIDPDDPEVHAAHGRALAELGKTTDAARALELALAFTPRDPPALHRLAAALYDRLGETRRAAAHRQAAAVSAGPRDAGPLNAPRGSPPRPRPVPAAPQGPLPPTP